MSSTNPPNPNVSTFNNLYWSITDIPLTQSQADRRYLKYPVAQGKETLQAIDVNGVANFNQPITMTSATAANRTITTTNLNINNTSNTAVGVISGSSSSIFYDNNANSGTHNFYASDAGGTQTNPLNISSSSINANRPLVLAGGSSADRTVTTTNINVTNATNTAVGTISGSGNNIIYDNNTSTGNHQFKVQNGGTEETPVTINSNGLILNTIGDYIQFPDGTQQTTAGVTVVRTYSELIRPTTTNALTDIRTITIPAGCYKIDVTVWGSGGLAGTVEDPSVNGQGQNGTGGGGATARSTLNVFPSGTMEIIFQSNAGGNFGFTRLRLVTPVNWIAVTAFNGGDGGNASGTTPGSAPQGGTRTAVGNTEYAGPWWIAKNTAGTVGTIYPAVPTAAGAPAGHAYQDGGVGVGDRRYSFIAPNCWLSGAVLITYYIS